MNETMKLLQLLGYSPQNMEDRMVQDYIQWCTDKCYVTQGTVQTPMGPAVQLSISERDLQSLLADAPLFNYWKSKYADCILDFLEDTEGMHPEPNIAEARMLFKRRTMQTYRYFNQDLIKRARTKKIANDDVHSRN